MDFPVLLETEEIPVIKAYSLESSIAEKFETMIKLSLLNSRMKDFYDIYSLSKRKYFEGRVLQEAIFQTFQRRKTPFGRNQPVFQEVFINSDEKQREWCNFEKRIRVIKPELFRDVMIQIKIFLHPIFDSICNEEEFFLYWVPTKNQWSKK
ncbi:MAG: nucleotidyl transferase AbiEii/AbiGii toxin family protein [Oscillospiraceae bacterium]|nr:nucleotidyl transferase AbiEii/AbiGii toxin family protein [Oscillospiraceae bacterium]